jgi:hypothetical protein
MLFARVFLMCLLVEHRVGMQLIISFYLVEIDFNFYHARVMFNHISAMLIHVDTMIFHVVTSLSCIHR